MSPLMHLPGTQSLKDISQGESQKAAGSGSGNDKQCCETCSTRSTSLGVTFLGLSVLACTVMTLNLKT